MRWVTANANRFVYPPRRTSPSTPITFQFDQTLIEDTLGNKLQPNALLVDNLTVDWLRGRLADLETALKECDDKQTRLLVADGSSASGSTAASPVLPHNGSMNGNNGSLRDTIKYGHHVVNLRPSTADSIKLFA